MHNSHWSIKFPEISDFNEIISEVSTYEIPNISYQGVRYMPIGFYEWVGGKKPKSKNPDTSIRYCVKISPEWVDKIENHLISGFRGLWPKTDIPWVKDGKIILEGRDLTGIGNPHLFRIDSSTIPEYLL
jgi:hypothetical protein